MIVGSEVALHEKDNRWHHWEKNLKKRAENVLVKVLNWVNVCCRR